MMARVLAISPAAVTAWQRRQAEAPWASDRRGRPAVIPAAARKQIRQCYRDHFGEWGPQVLAAWSRRQELGDWSATTIAAVISDLRRPEPTPPPPVRYEIMAPQVMWSEDGTGFRQRGRKQELLAAQDEHARLKLNWRLVRGPAQGADVVSYLQEAFERYGPPLVLKHDGDSIFHEAGVEELLERYGVVPLTSPPGWPGYNGKQERSMRDIKSYERAMRRHGVRGSLSARLSVAMHDLNEERPRPVLGGRTAREAYQESNIALPDRRVFMAAVDREEQRLLAEATSRRQRRSARRRAIENVLVRDGLMVIVGDVSHDLSSGAATE